MRNSTQHARGYVPYDNRATVITENRRKVMEAYREQARIKARNNRIAMYCAYALAVGLALECCYIAGWL